MHTLCTFTEVCGDAHRGDPCALLSPIFSANTESPVQAKHDRQWSMKDIINCLSQTQLPVCLKRILIFFQELLCPTKKHLFLRLFCSYKWSHSISGQWGVTGTLPSTISRKLKSEGQSQLVEVPGTARNMDMVPGMAQPTCKQKDEDHTWKTQWEGRRELELCQSKGIPTFSFFLREKEKQIHICLTHNFLDFVLHAVKWIEIIMFLKWPMTIFIQF